MSHDDLFSKPLAHASRFRFDEEVARVFPDMIKRSVPGYSTIINMIADFANRYARSNTRCYDLGCSLGAASLAIRHSILASDCVIEAVDNSEAMLERCRHVIEADCAPIPVNLHCADIRHFPIENASLVVLNFTLQFIPLDERDALLERIFKGMNDGAALILSEKITFDDAAHDELMIDLHHQFKRQQGYSDLEIASKRSALENVLLPETPESHRQRLKRAGFRSADLWFQCFNFSSWVAIK